MTNLRNAAILLGLSAGLGFLPNSANAASACPGTDGLFTVSGLTNQGGPAPLPNDMGTPCQLNTMGIMATVGTQWTAGQINTNGSYSYSLTSSGMPFSTFSLNADIGFSPTDGSITKEIFSDAGLTMLIGTVTSNSTPSATITLSDQTLTTIYVKDTWMVGTSGQMNSISNNFKLTPGPLPVLGAGAAFGFSRKLRSRIKASA